MTNCRILSMDEQWICFRYKDQKAKRWRACQVSPQEFIRRFLQHVLPRGFHKVRYYGLWHPSKQKQVKQVQLLLSTVQVNNEVITSDAVSNESELPSLDVHEGVLCAHCKIGHLILVKKLFRKKSMDP